VNQPPNFPSVNYPNGATGVSLTPTYNFYDTDPEGDDIQFKIVLYQSDCSTIVATYDMASGQTGWSPTFNGSAASGKTYLSATAGTNPPGISYTPSTPLSFSTTYCWTAFAKDPAGNNSYRGSTQSFTTGANSAPNAPNLTSPSSGATGVSATPTFNFDATDSNSDDIQFTLNLYQSDCSTAIAGYPISMASGQTGWSPTFNGSAGSGLSYLSLTAAPPGVSYTPASALGAGITYCWSVSALDPGGSNTSTTSGTQLFTTAGAGGDQVNIGGGVNINGGTTIQ
jgi:hypothetical protein